MHRERGVYQIIKNMKELREQFDGRGEVKGYTFSQISKTDWGFIYEVEHGGHRHYEVFKKRLNHRFGTVSYPSSKAFGIWAWTCQSMDKAEQKLEEIRIAHPIIKAMEL